MKRKEKLLQSKMNDKEYMENALIDLFLEFNTTLFYRYDDEDKVLLYKLEKNGHTVLIDIYDGLYDCIKELRVILKFKSHSIN